MSSSRKRWAVAVALLASLAFAAPRAARAADADGDPELRAREAFAAGRYEEAIEGYAKLYARTLHPVYLRNIARCYQKKHDPQSAIDEFQDYLTKTRSGSHQISGEEREEVEGYIKDMRAEQARAAAPVTPLATPAAARPLPVAPASQQTTLTASAPPAEESQPIYTRWWFWTILGVVAVGVATTIVLTSGTSKPTCTTTLGCE